MKTDPVRRSLQRLVMWLRDEHEYGTIDGTEARRRVRSGVCEFVIFPKGYVQFPGPGGTHTEEKWVRFHESHWHKFAAHNGKLVHDPKEVRDEHA